MTDIILNTGSDERRMTLATFLRDNEFDETETTEIRDCIANGVEYWGGGGASPEWCVRPARG